MIIKQGFGAENIRGHTLYDWLSALVI